MDFGLYCDICKVNFDTSVKLPMLIPCGHTVCKDCALEV